MPSAYVLYLEDTAVGPALELLRRVCQPKSKSLPHITVRYPVHLLEGSDLSVYENTSIDDLHIAGPGSFNLEDGDVPEAIRNPIIFLRCESRLLEALSYKPDFPDSVFHITVYDGPSREFAARVLSVLDEFSWGFGVKMAPTNLTRIPIGSPSVPSRFGPVRLSPASTFLLRDWCGSDAEPPLLLDLTDDERISIVRQACEHIHSLHQEHDSLPADVPTGRLTSRGPDTGGFQATLWEESDVHDDLAGPGAAWWTRRQQSRRSGQRVGLFLTPPELAQEMVAAALGVLGPEQPIDFGDPAIGGAIFFATLLRVADREQIRSAVGIEVDPFRGQQTMSKWRGSDLRVLTGNFLDSELDATRSLILANPPYVRFQRLQRSDSMRWQDRIQRSLGLSVDGRADLYIYFVLTAHDWLAPEGISGWLLPSEFLQANYGRVLRDYLAKHVELLYLHTYDIGTPRFENARVSSTIVMFRKRVPNPRHLARLSAGGSLAQPLETRVVTTAELVPLEKWVPAFWSRQSTRRSDGVRISDLFVVRRGIATGSNRHFVLTSAEVGTLEVPSKWIKPVIPKARNLVGNIIDADRNGNPLVGRPLWLIDADASMDSVRRESPKLAAYLERVASEVGSRRLLRARNPFYRQERRPSPRFFVGNMGRTSIEGCRSRFFLNRSRAVVLNNYFALYPRPHVTDLLSSGEVRDTELLDALCSISEEEIAREGRVYVSGLHKIEPRELERLIVPDLPRRVIEATDRWRAEGR